MKILIFYKEETLEAEMSYYGHILIWPFLFCLLLKECGKCVHSYLTCYILIAVCHKRVYAQRIQNICACFELVMYRLGTCTF
jgi:hypothetical protein